MQNDSEALQQFLSGRKTLMQRAADLLVSGRSSKKAHNNTTVRTCTTNCMQDQNGSSHQTMPFNHVKFSPLIVSCQPASGAATQGVTSFDISLLIQLPTCSWQFKCFRVLVCFFWSWIISPPNGVWQTATTAACSATQLAVLAGWKNGRSKS